MDNTDRKKLIDSAKEAAKNSYSPYSQFKVGAALFCEDGTIIKGTNVENRSYGLTICAERNAIFSAISAKKKKYIALAIYTPDSKKPLPPCGACRQVISEFVHSNFLIIMAGQDNYIEKTVADLLPYDSLHELNKQKSDNSKLD